MTSPEITAGERLIEGAKEALAVARGEQPAARLHHNGHTYVPLAEFEALSAALAAGAPGVKVLPDNFIERHAEGYEWRGDSGDYTPKEHEVAMLIDFGHSLLSELPADPLDRVLQTMRAVLKEARGVFKCLMASGDIFASTYEPASAPPARQDRALREALHDRFDSWWRKYYDGADLARGAACDAWCSAIDAALAQSATPVQQAAPSGEGE